MKTTWSRERIVVLVAGVLLVLWGILGLIYSFAPLSERQELVLRLFVAAPFVVPIFMVPYFESFLFLIGPFLNLVIGGILLWKSVYGLDDQNQVYNSARLFLIAIVVILFVGLLFKIGVESGLFMIGALFSLFVPILLLVAVIFLICGLLSSKTKGVRSSKKRRKLFRTYESKN